MAMSQYLVTLRCNPNVTRESHSDSVYPFFAIPQGEGGSEESQPRFRASTTMSDSKWTVPASERSKRTVNPIRVIVDSLQIPQNTPKPLLKLSLGDPTVFGNMDVPDSVIDDIVIKLRTKRINGYLPSTGLPEARRAIALKFSTKGAEISEDDVIINSGASGAIRMAIETLLNPGDNILLPAPGFPLYECCAVSHDVQPKFYGLLASKGWEADIKHMEKLVDSKTRAIVINNPSNPCGSVFSKSHLLDILAFAEKHRLVIIADEIYAHITFSKHTFIPIASLTKEVPVLSIGGLAKQYCVPGWRVGWILIHDRKGRLREVRAGLLRMSRLILGANSIVQHSIPQILHRTDTQYYKDFSSQLEGQANAFISEFRDGKVPGLKVIEPQGAMYCMLEVDASQFCDIKDAFEFAQKLLLEEYVFVLPGTCFRAPKHFRCVFLAPEKTLREAAQRIKGFCQKHRKKCSSLEMK
ncbi:hypothetical protein AAMO2058_001342300 [Amorphochlora amoebiformis]